MQIKYHTELSMEFRVSPSMKPIFIILLCSPFLYAFHSSLNPALIIILCLVGMIFVFGGYVKAWGVLDASSNFIYLRHTTLFKRWEYECPLSQISAFRFQKIGLGTYELVIDNITTSSFHWILVSSPKKLTQLVSELNDFLAIDRSNAHPALNLPPNILPQKPKGTCKYCWGEVYLTPRFKDIFGQYAHQGCQDAENDERRNRNTNNHN